MDLARADAILQMVTDWAKEEDCIEAAAIVGSWARGNPGVDSDLDFMILSAEWRRFIACVKWVNGLPWSELQMMPALASVEDHGAARSVRICFGSGEEVEFCFSGPEWANMNPIDIGTRGVVTSGFRTLVDKRGRMRSLVAACLQTTEGQSGR